MTFRQSGRSVGALVLLAFLAVLAAACGCARGQQGTGVGADAADGASRAAPVPSPPPRTLAGAGAVAFDRQGRQLAWASGEQVRSLDLATGRERALQPGGWVDDLGYAPDGSLWILAGDPQRWAGGTRACRAVGVEAQRLLASDDAGAVVAGYAHSDGVGMLRHQVWLDAGCKVVREDTAALPAQVADAEADPGAPLGRDTLRPPPAAGGAAGTLAVSPDGRWQVVTRAGARVLEAVPAGR